MTSRAGQPRLPSVSEDPTTQSEATGATSLTAQTGPPGAAESADAVGPIRRDEAHDDAPAHQESQAIAVGEAPATAEDTPAATEDTPAAVGLRSRAQLRDLLGLPASGEPQDPRLRRNGWIVTGVVGLIAMLTRFIGLQHPRSLMFDEIYYIKDSYALWHNGYESNWAEDSDALFNAGDFSGLSDKAAFIVHPQLGKWLIGVGGEIFGWDSTFGWRFMPALAGVLTVVLLARLTMRLTGSPALAGLAGLLLAIDGVAITESRIGLLDVFIGLFATVSVYCLVRDREWFREHMAARMEGTTAGTWAALPLVRPWLLAAGLSLGLACSIKWSGAYLLAAAGILTVVWDLTALHRIRARQWFADGIFHRGPLNFVHLVPTAAIVYVLGWWSWFTHDKAYKHGWAAAQRAAGQAQRTWLPDSLNDLFEYHRVIYTFHVSLDDPHKYMSHPMGWLIQLRPTSFYWPDSEEMAGASCGADKCVQAITSIGNIPIWWSAVIAVLFCIGVLVNRQHDWRAWVALIGYVGLYLPWFMYRDRTIFTFYTVAFVPFVVLALVLALGAASGLLKPVPGSARARAVDDDLASGKIGPGKPTPTGAIAGYLGLYDRITRHGLPESWAGVPLWRQRTDGLALAAVVVALALVFAALWWPIWTGQTVSYRFWHMHMLLPSWV